MKVNILKKMTLWDKILISTIIIINMSFILFNILNISTGKKIIEVKVNNEIVQRISITDKTEDTYSFQFEENTGYLEVKSGSVRMLEMEKNICPERICSDTGWISNDYENIVCLPNSIIVNIEENEDNDVDIII